MITLANAGVPMLFVFGPVLVLAFIPIVAIEAGWLWWRVKGKPHRILAGVSLANGASTFLGVPLTWIALVALQVITGGGAALGADWRAVTWQAAWLVPYEEALDWMIPAAALVLCLPFFVASALVEGFVLVRWLRPAPRKRIWGAVWAANAITYGVLAVFWSLPLLYWAPPPQ